MGKKYVWANRNNEYIGQFADDTSADAWLTAAGWTHEVGLLYYDTTHDCVKMSDGTNWQMVQNAPIYFDYSGETNLKIAVEAAIAAGYSGYRGCPATAYVVTDLFALPSNFTLNMTDCNIDCNGMTGFYVIETLGSFTGTTVPLATNASVLSRTFTVVTGTLGVGDADKWCRIYHNTVRGSSKQGELNRIKSVTVGATDTVVLHEMPKFDYQAAVAPAVNAVIELVDVNPTDITIIGGNWEGPGRTSANSFAHFYVGKYIRVTDAHIWNFGQNKVFLQSSWHCMVDKNKIEFGYIAGGGYGIGQADCCRWNIIKDNYLVDHSHAITAGWLDNLGMVHDSWIHHNHCAGDTWIGIEHHLESGYDNVIEANYIDGTVTGITDSGAGRTIIRGNNIRTLGAVASSGGIVFGSNGSDKCVVVDNEIHVPASANCIGILAQYVNYGVFANNTIYGGIYGIVTNNMYYCNVVNNNLHGIIGSSSIGMVGSSNNINNNYNGNNIVGYNYAISYNNPLYCSFENNNLYYCNTLAVYINGTAVPLYSMVSGNTIRYTNGDGIRIYNCDKVNIRGNQIWNFDRSSSGLSYGVRITSANRIAITDNTIDDLGATSAGSIYVDNGTCSDIYIRNNSCEGFPEKGLIDAGAIANLRDDDIYYDFSGETNLETAINWAVAHGFSGYKGCPATAYVATTKTDSLPDYFTIDMTDCTIDASGLTENYVFDLTGTFSGAPVALATNASQMTATITTVTGTLGVGDIGKYCRIYHDTVTGSSKQGEINRVLNVTVGATDTIELYNMPKLNYATAANAAIELLSDPVIGIRIKGGTWIGPGATSDSTFAKFKASHHCTVEDTYVYDFGNSAVYMNTCWDMNIRYNRFGNINRGSYGWVIRLNDACRWNRIHDNYLFDCNFGIFLGYDDAVGLVCDSWIHHNEIHGADDWGIDGSSTCGYDNTFDDNDLSNCRAGILALGLGGYRIHKNKIRFLGGTAGDAGIYASGTFTQIIDNWIWAINTDGTRVGLYLISFTAGLVSGNYVQGCNWGTYLQACTLSEIVNNSFIGYSVTGYGIGGTTSITYNNINNNYMYAYGYGIYLRDPFMCNINGNYMYGIGNSACYIFGAAGAADYVNVCNNYVYSCGVDAYRFYNIEEINFVGNVGMRYDNNNGGTDYGLKLLTVSQFFAHGNLLDDYGTTSAGSVYIENGTCAAIIYLRCNRFEGPIVDAGGIADTTSDNV